VHAEASGHECCANAEHLSTVLVEKAGCAGSPPQVLLSEAAGSDPEFDNSDDQFLFANKFSDDR
jgi:hypothetical protein